MNLDLPVDSVASKLVTVGKFLRLFVSRDLYLLSGKKSTPLSGCWEVGEDNVLTLLGGAVSGIWGSRPDLIPLCLSALESRHRIQT